MLDFIFTPVRLAFRLAGFAVVVVLVVATLFLSSARADEKTAYDFDYKNAESLREYLRYFGHGFAWCKPGQILIGMTVLNGTPSLLCASPERRSDEKLRDLCTNLGVAVDKPLILISRNDSHLRCGVPKKMAVDGEPQQDA